MITTAIKQIKSYCLLIVSVLLLLACIAPGVAFAKSYTMPQVEQDVTINTDGSIHVVEIRSFDFNGNFHGVYWNDSLPNNASYELISVDEVAEDGSLTNFTPGTADRSGVNNYYLETSEGKYYLELRFDKTDTRASFRIEYSIRNAVTAYKDVAELYWKYVGPEWAVDSQNVRTKFHFENVAETIEAGSNVHAYGHGALNGNITFDNDDILYTVPYVSAGQFAEARILFPLSFVSDMNPGTTEKYQSILQEEKSWAEQTNELRNQAKLFYYGKSILLLVLVGLLFFYTLRNFFKYGKEYTQQFQGKYYREKPSDLHPAILGAFWRGGANTDDLSASILQASDKGYLTLEKTSRQTPGLFGSSFGSKIEEDYILHNAIGDYTKIDDPIDQATMQLLFGVFAKGADTLQFSDIENFAKNNFEQYNSLYKNWFNKVDATKDVSFYEPEGNKKKTTGHVIVVLCIFMLIAAVVTGLSLTVPITIISFAIALLLTFAIALINRNMDRKTESANELHAKLAALRNWLQDFTLLNEAPPTHVKVWKDLIVMAVVLGVADKVIEQLKTSMPQILSDPEIMPMTMWYMGDFTSPMNSFTHTISSSNQIARTEMMQELAQSASSSDWGGGGGFSIGGGGGFGGGGGGAF